MSLKKMRNLALGLIVLVTAAVATTGSPVARADDTSPSITVTPLGYGAVLVKGANWAQDSSHVSFLWTNEAGYVDVTAPGLSGYYTHWFEVTTTVAIDVCSLSHICYSDPGGTFQVAVVTSANACGQVDKFIAEGPAATDPTPDDADTWTDVRVYVYVPWGPLN